MKVTEISFVRVYSEAWDGVYANGKLVSQSHAVRLRDVIYWLADQGPVAITGYSSAIADEEWICDHGQLPDDLADVKMAPDE